MTFSLMIFAGKIPTMSDWLVTNGEGLVGHNQPAVTDGCCTLSSTFFWVNLGSFSFQPQDHCSLNIFAGVTRLMVVMRLMMIIMLMSSYFDT